jgi:gluconokinase
VVIVLMGVSGAGKTTVGRTLAGSLGWHFEDADDHHPAANREKMRRGEALTEEDRYPWLLKLASLIRGWIDANRNAVLACSALTRRSREILGVGSTRDVRLVHLRGPEALVQARLEGRTGHFFNPKLLASQFAALEEPDDALAVDIGPSPDEIAAKIRQKLEIET